MGSDFTNETYMWYNNPRLLCLTPLNYFASQPMYQYRGINRTYSYEEAMTWKK
jgi:hypothetical protein